LKKILKHLRLPASAPACRASLGAGRSLADRWDIKRKPAPRANGQPTEAFIFYDESSSPGAKN